MTCLRDEVLVDYADNRLSIDKRRAVEHVLAIDTEARHKVALFKLSAYLLRQAFAGIDFTGVPAWLDVLFQRYDQRAAGMRRAGWWTCVWRTGGRLPSGWAALRLSLASSLLLGICLGGLTAVVTTPSDGSERLLVLGELAVQHLVEARGLGGEALDGAQTAEVDDGAARRAHRADGDFVSHGSAL